MFRRMTICGMMLIGLILLNGCAAAIKYSYENSYQAQHSLPYNLVVDNFKDARPESEKNVERDSIGMFYSIDKNFKGDIAEEISKSIAEHLSKSKLFRQVRCEDIADDLLNDPSIREILIAQGIDLVLVGHITHFSGFMSGSAGASMLFGAVGVLTEAIANPKTVGGKVAYIPVKLVDLKNNKIVWEGNIEYQFEKKDTFYKAPVNYVLMALKEANDKLTRQLAEVLE